MHALFWTVTLTILAWPHPAAAQRFATGQYDTPAGQSPTAAFLRDVGIEQHLDAQLPLDTTFRDESGRSVKLGDFFRDKPVVLALVYYRCPMLCTQVLNGFLNSSQAIPLEIGRDYEVVTVSFDPRETPAMAAEKKDRYVRAYHRQGAARGWHFLTGDKQAIDRLARTVGFRYRYDPPSDQFAHASGIVLATPDGRLARYFYGIEYSPHDLRLGLVESSSGRIGSPVDQVLLLCYHYDPLTGQYGLAISGVLRAAGSLTVLLLAGFLVVMVRQERRRPKLVRESAAPATTGASPPSPRGTPRGEGRGEGSSPLIDSTPCVPYLRVALSSSCSDHPQSTDHAPPHPTLSPAEPGARATTAPSPRGTPRGDGPEVRGRSELQDI